MSRPINKIKQEFKNSTFGALWSVYVVVIGCTVFLYTSMKEDMRIQKQEIATQDSRSDRLYEMFVDLLRNGK